MGAYASRMVAWLGLLALLALTVALSFAPLGPFRLAVGLAIAAAKAGLIFWLYMELRRADGVERIAALGAVVILAFLIGLVCIDFAIRGGAI